MMYIDGAECITSGELCIKIGIIVTRSNIEKISGITPYAVIKSACYWNVRDYPHICASFARHFYKLRTDALQVCSVDDFQENLQVTI